MRGMQMRRMLSPALRHRAMARHGLVTHDELDAEGLTRRVRSRMVADGTLRHVGRGLYAVHAPTLGTWARAGAVIGGSGSAVGGWHALILHGIDSIAPSMPSGADRVITVWTPAHVRRSAPPNDPTMRWWFRRDCANRLTRSTQVRRLVDRHDAALDVCDGLPELDVIGLMTRLLQERQIDPARLLALLEGRARHGHRKLLRALVSDAAQGVHSALEHRYVSRVERPHRLPTPQRQVIVGPRAADGWYSDQALAIEFDGWGYHRDRVHLDTRIDNLRAAMGVETLHFSWMDVVGDPCGTASIVAAMLQQRGWAGSMRHCGVCPARLNTVETHAPLSVHRLPVRPQKTTTAAHHQR